MLPKSDRLNLKTSFKWVASGRKKETFFFKLFFREGENSKPLVGIAISKVVFKKAHDRNRARRLSATVVYNIYSTLRNNINLVMMPKINVVDSDIDNLQKDLENVKEIRNLNN